MRAARETSEKNEPHPAIATRDMIDTSDICWMFRLKVARLKRNHRYNGTREWGRRGAKYHALHSHMHGDGKGEVRLSQLWPFFWDTPTFVS